MNKSHIIQKYKRIILLVVLLFITLLFYILNIQTPLFADDFSYFYSFYDGKRISKLNDIFLSLWAHYHSANGRIILHFLAQTFLMIGKKYFNIINTFSFLILGLLIFYHVTEDKLEDHISLVIFIYCSLFMFAPAFGQSFLWLTGSSNYLYGIELILIYLIPFRILSRRGGVKNKKAHSYILVQILFFFCMLILGFIVGATNENTSIALIAIVLAFIVYYKVHRIRIMLWMFGGWVGNITGCIFMLTSPGELSRLDKLGGISIAKVLKNTVRLTLDLVDYFSVLILLFAIIFSLYIYTKQDNTVSRESLCNKLNVFSISIIYFLGFLSSVYSMIVSPVFPDRAWSGPLVLFLIALLSFYTSALSGFDMKSFIQIRFIFCCIFFMISFCVYGKALYELIKIDKQNDIRVTMIEESIGKGQKTISLPAIRSDSKYSCFGFDGDLAWDADDWPNTVLEKYYGIPGIVRDDCIVLEKENE